MVPRVVNLLTLVFLAGTTWWSSAQRPLVHEASAALAAPRAQQVSNKPSQLPLDNSAPAQRVSSTPSIGGDSVITVGFNAVSLH